MRDGIFFFLGQLKSKAFMSFSALWKYSTSCLETYHCRKNGDFFFFFLIKPAGSSVNIDHKDPQRMFNFQIYTEKDDSSGSTINAILFFFFRQFKEEDKDTEIRTGFHIKSLG